MNVLCIMGKSASGKSSVANKLILDKDKFHLIKSYTTRKVRENDSDDILTHTFVSKEFRQNTKEEVLVEYINKEKDYCSWVSESLFDKDKINIFVIDPIAFVELTKLKNDWNIFGIYLRLSEEERKRRYLKRNKENKCPKDIHLSEEQLLISAGGILHNFEFVNANEKTPSEICDDVLKTIYDRY